MVTCNRKVSPCPSVFTYDDSKDTDDTWYGTIKLETNVDLHGINVDVIFDKAVSTFGAYHFNDITTYDYLEYRVQNQNFKLEQGRTLVMNIYVRYAHQFPHVTQIRFNGQNVCPSQASTSFQPIYPTSNVQTGSRKPARREFTDTKWEKFA